MESVSVDAVSIPRGLMDYVQALIHRLELRYQGHRIMYQAMVTLIRLGCMIGDVIWPLYDYSDFECKHDIWCRVNTREA